MSEQTHFSVEIDLGPAFKAQNKLDGMSFLASLDKIKDANVSDPEDGDKVLAVDMVIIALGYFYACGGSHEELISIMAERVENTVANFE